MFQVNLRMMSRPSRVVKNAALRASSKGFEVSNIEYPKHEMEDDHENKTGVVRNPGVHRIRDCAWSTGFSQLQPQPKLYAISHLRLGFQQRQPDPEFDTGAGSDAGHRLGITGQGTAEGGGKRESRPDRHRQWRDERADLL